MAPVKINTDFCFKLNKDLTIGDSKAALSIFAEGSADAIKLDEKFKYIFLDTNVLLDYYGMSKNEKTKLLTFFQRNKDRIYLPYRVQIEFMNNRLGAIKKDLFNPLNQITSDFVAACNEIKRKYKSYLDGKKNILFNDFPEVWSELNSTNDKLADLMDNSELHKKIQDAVNESTEIHRNIEITDELLDICSQFNLLPTLDTEEIKFIETLYDELATVLGGARETEKWKHTFPGSGDIGAKDYPYGDFIIYHEMLKFMRDGGTHSIFLTNEKSKQDWMQKDKSPIISYIEKAYCLTGFIMFIIHAEMPLKVSFENIHEPIEENKSLNSFLGLHPSYTYYVSGDEDLSVKSNVLREFLLKYKKESEFSYSTGEGVFSSIVITALLDDSKERPTLYIKPNTIFFEATQEGKDLKQVYQETLELWCDLNKIERKGNEYLVFWRRSTKCKGMIMEQFMEKYKHDEIRMEYSFSGTHNAIDVIASSTLGTAILNIPLNPSSRNEKDALTSAFEQLTQLES